MVIILEILNEKGSGKPVLLICTISNPVSKGRKATQHLQAICD